MPAHRLTVIVLGVLVAALLTVAVAGWVARLLPPSVAALMPLFALGAAAVFLWARR